MVTIGLKYITKIIILVEIWNNILLKKISINIYIYFNKYLLMNPMITMIKFMIYSLNFGYIFYVKAYKDLKTETNLLIVIEFTQRLLGIR